MYIGADDDKLWLALNDQATSENRKLLNLGPIVRGHWRRFLFHFIWHSDPKKGLVEVWVDGKQAIAPFRDQTMYPRTRMYPVAGLYRNGHVGDPNLKYGNGSPVYPTGDGAPGFMFSGGFARGNTRAEVDQGGGTVAIPTTVDPVKAKEGLQLLIDEKQDISMRVAQLNASIARIGTLLPLSGDLITIRDALQARVDVIGKLLDKGPW
jgi:hypothetical protein